MVTVRGAILAATHARADGVAGVAPDFFEVLELSGGRLGIAVGDVKSLTAVDPGISGRLRATLRAPLLAGGSPADAVTRANQLLLWLEPGQLVTVAVVVVDPLARLVTHASAGAPPVLVVDDHGSYFLSEGRGLPLGASDDAAYREQSETLSPGARLVVHTDGLAARPGRLADVVADASTDPEDIGRRLMAGHDTADDAIAVVVVLHPAPQHTFATELPIDLTSLSLLRRQLDEWLDAAEIAEPDRGAVAVAVGEAVSNALEHADATPGSSVRVNASRTSTTVDISVCDEGRWRDEHDPDRGRGLMVMKGLMDEVDLRHYGRGTEVVMQRRLSTTPNGRTGS